MSDNENDWGNKKMQYYSMNKRENEDDSDFVEEEKEAIRIQQKKLEKIKQSKLLAEDSEEEEKDNKKEDKKQLFEDDDTTNPLPIDKNDILQDISKAQNNLSEVSNDFIQRLKMISDDNFFKIPLAESFLKTYKDTLLSLSGALLFKSLFKLEGKITSHHPCIKTIAMLEYILSKSSKTKEQIQSYLEKLMELNEAKKIKDKTTKMLSSKRKRAHQEEEEEEEKEEDDLFVKSQMVEYNKLKKKKEENINKHKSELIKEIEKKNELGTRKANKEVLKARGIYRKRKQYKGNAKVSNREKYMKKEKERKKMVKEYVGKPDVYMGEATGIRRNYIRSTKINS